jgi:hypothetical protein
MEKKELKFVKELLATEIEAAKNVLLGALKKHEDDGDDINLAPAIHLALAHLGIHVVQEEE